MPFSLRAFDNWLATRLTTDFFGNSSVPVKDKDKFLASNVHFFNSNMKIIKTESAFNWKSHSTEKNNFLFPVNVTMKQNFMWLDKIYVYHVAQVSNLVNNNIRHI